MANRYVVSGYCGESLFNCSKSLRGVALLWRVVIVASGYSTVANHYVASLHCGESLLWRIIILPIILHALLHKSLKNIFCIWC